MQESPAANCAHSPTAIQRPGRKVNNGETFNPIPDTANGTSAENMHIALYTQDNTGKAAIVSAMPCGRSVRRLLRADETIKDTYEMYFSLLNIFSVWRIQQLPSPCLILRLSVFQ